MQKFWYIKLCIHGAKIMLHFLQELFLSEVFVQQKQSFKFVILAISQKQTTKLKHILLIKRCTTSIACTKNWVPCDKSVFVGAFVTSLLQPYSLIILYAWAVLIIKTVWCKRHAPTCLSSVKMDEKSAPDVRWQKMHYTHQMNCHDLIFLTVPLKRWFHWVFAVFTFLETEKVGKSFCDPEYHILGHHQSKSAFLMFFCEKNSRRRPSLSSSNNAG